jgi:hypothetical protein
MLEGIKVIEYATYMAAPGRDPSSATGAQML